MFPRVELVYSIREAVTPHPTCGLPVRRVVAPKSSLLPRGAGLSHCTPRESGSSLEAARLPEARAADLLFSSSYSFSRRGLTPWVSASLYVRC